jgi:glutaredoxin 3
MSNVVVYASNFCPYCYRALKLLDDKGVEYTLLDVDFNPPLRREMEQRSQRPTVPQIFIGQHHVGGYDDLSALEQAGGLDALLTEASREAGQSTDQP